jgi:enoyl-CoA hydratase
LNALTYHQDGAVGWITISNPPYNALTHPVFAELQELQHFLATPSLKCAILTGEGRHFCSGADVEAMRDQARDPEGFRPQLDLGKALLNEITFATVPILAMIRGSCLGAGLEIALACHFRIASENAILGFPETEHNIMPGFGGPVLAYEQKVRRPLLELILSGRMLSGKDAFDAGFVDQVVLTSKLQASSVEFLHSLTANRSHVLIRAVMESLGNARRLPRQDALARETELFCQLAQQQFSEGSA